MSMSVDPEFRKRLIAGALQSVEVAAKARVGSIDLTRATGTRPRSLIRYRPSSLRTLFAQRCTLAIPSKRSP